MNPIPYTCAVCQHSYDSQYEDWRGFCEAYRLAATRNKMCVNTSQLIRTLPCCPWCFAKAKGWKK